MAITPKQLSIESSLVSDIYLALEDERFKAIVKRLKTHDFASLTKDNVFIWQLGMMNQAHLLNDDVLDLLEETTKIAKKRLTRLIVDNGYTIESEADEQLKGISSESPPPINNLDIQLKGYLDQTFLEIDNLVNQTLITTNFGKGIAQKIYEDIIKNATGSVITGLKTPQQAVSETIYKWLDKGIPSLFIDKGGNTWSIESYVRMVVNTTTRSAYNAIRMQRMDEFGIETCLMSYHSAARAACAPIQGKIVYMRPSKAGDKYPSVYDHGYKEAGGCSGINCTHTFTPWNPEVNIIHGHDDIPSAKQAKKNADIQSKQRQLERNIRGYKRKKNIASELGDTKTINRMNQNVMKNRAALRQIVDDHKFLHRDYLREKIFKNVTEEDKRKYLLPNWNKAEFSTKKLTHYALDPENKNGGADKARVFQSALGYNKGNFQSLYDQVMVNVGKYESEMGERTIHGQRYRVVMDIDGPNGKTVPVVTAWIVDNEDITRLVSIYVIRRND